MEMLKLSKKADYALIAVRHLATHRGDPSQSASDIADVYGISGTLLAKVLQRLAKHGVVTARHGSSGGYQLARHPKEISALDVIMAVDGPVVITSCITSHGNCDQSSTCTVREPLRRVNESISQVLSSVTISQMAEDSPDVALIGLSF
jgi:Rrf2 family protein